MCRRHDKIICRVRKKTSGEALFSTGLAMNLRSVHFRANSEERTMDPRNTRKREETIKCPQFLTGELTVSHPSLVYKAYF
jgi:hypothetical protein